MEDTDMTVTIEQIKARPGDLARNINMNMIERAYKDGKTLSHVLETEDPTDDYPANEQDLDAFERQILQHGIRVKSNPSEGIPADTFDRFETSDAEKILQLEYVHRVWRNVKFQGKRVLYGSDDTGVNTSMRPYVDAGQERYTQMAPAIPITELVAQTTPIRGNAYRAVYLTDSTDDVRFVRVGETAEIPGAALTSGEHTVNLYKFGRKIKSSYEALRRLPIDIVGFHLARMAVQAEVDKVALLIDIAINGDGNAGTSGTNYNLTTLDSAASAGTLTLKGWLSFKQKFTNPYSLTTALVQEAVALQLYLLNLGSANVPLFTVTSAAGFGGITPINPELRDNVRLGTTADAPALKIVGFDNRFAIERVTEIGSNITETAQWVTNQTKELVMSEVEGYDVMDQAAIKTLNINA